MPMAGSFSGCDDDGVYWTLTRWQSTADAPNSGVVIDIQVDYDLNNADKLGNVSVSFLARLVLDAFCLRIIIHLEADPQKLCSMA